MKSTSRLSNLLKEKLEERRVSDDQYSLRKFSKDLGMNSGILSSIISGKRKVSYDLAEKICMKMGMAPNQILLLLAEPEISQRVNMKKMAQEHYEIFTNGNYQSLLALLKTKDFRTDVNWIASRLEVDEETALTMIRKIVRTGVAKFNDQSMLVRDSTGVYSMTEKSDEIKKSIEDHLTKTLEYLRKRDDSVSEFPMMVIAINSEKIPEAKRRILNFLLEMRELLQDDQADEVYRLSIQFLPMIAVRDKKNS